MRSVTGDIMQDMHSTITSQIKRYLPVISSGASKKEIGSSNYPYAVTRIRAMKIKLVPRDEYPRFLNMSQDEIIRKIGESDYKSDIDELSREYKGANLIEHALNRNMATSFQKVLRITEGIPHELVSEYLKKYDISDVKTIIRGKMHGISPADIRTALVSGGSLRYTFLSGLTEKSYDEVLEALAATEYGDLLTKLDGANLSAFENALDKYYYKSLLAIPGFPGSSDRRLFDRFVRREIDVQNLNLLFRLKKANIYFTEASEAESGEVSQVSNVADLLIDGGLEFGLDALKVLAALPYEKFVTSLRSSSYWTALQEHVDGKELADVDLTDISNSLLNFNLKKITSNSLQSIVSIVPILEYVIYKENEVRNLRIIVRGKNAGMDNNLIKEQLVII